MRLFTMTVSKIFLEASKNLFSIMSRSDFPKGLRLLFCSISFPLVLFFSQCVTGKEVCGGDASLDPKNDCLPFDDGALEPEGGLPSDLEAIPADACELHGEGTEQNPYKVCDYWVIFRIGASRDDALPLDAVYELTGDIDASITCGPDGCEDPDESYAGAKPIGNAQAPFVGKIKGNGHSINGLYINRAGLDNVGLFGVLGAGAQIEGLRLGSVFAQGGSQVGALAGSTNGGEVINSSVSSATVRGTGKVGGLIGENGENSKIVDSNTNADVSGQNDVGGLVGLDSSTLQPFSIDRSHSLGKLRSSGQNIGGLVGKQVGSTIRNSYSKASVQGPDDSPYAPSAVGGLVGYSDRSSIVKQSYAAPSKIYGASKVGGLIGHLEGALSHSYAGYHANSEDSGMLVLGARDSIGGLVGYMGGSSDAKIEKSYSAVYMVKGKDANTSRLGGLVGYLDQGSVQKSFTASSLSAPPRASYVGALIGHCKGSSNPDLNSLYFRRASTKPFGLPSPSSRETQADCYAEGGGLPSTSKIYPATGQFLKDGLPESSSNHLAWGLGPSFPWANLNNPGYPCLRGLPVPGASGTSCASSSTGQTYPSQSVTGLEVRSGSTPGTYTISWSSLGDSSIRYRLEQKLEGGDYQPVSENLIEGTSFEIVGQDYGSYSYRVLACYGPTSCNPAASNVRSHRVTAIPVPSLSLKDKDNNADPAYAVSWEKMGGSIVRYEWAERKDTSWPDPLSSLVPTESISAQGLAAGPVKLLQSKPGPRTYYYRVRACGLHNNECGAWSSVLRVPVDLPALGVISEQSGCQPSSQPSPPPAKTLRIQGGASACYDGVFRLSWNTLARSDVTGYEIEERLSSEPWGNAEDCPSCRTLDRISSRSTSALTIEGKSAGTYVYRIRPCGVEEACSPWANRELSVVVPEIAAPSSPSIDDEGEPSSVGTYKSYDGAYTLSWSTVANADRYIIEESNKRRGGASWSDPPSKIEVSGAGSSSKALSGRTETGKSYKYQLRACNQRNCSSASPAVRLDRLALGSAVFQSALSVVYLRTYDLSWRSVTGAVSYSLQELKRSAKLPSGQQIDWSSAGVNSYTSTATSYGITATGLGFYYYRVRPCASTSPSVCGNWSQIPVPVEVKGLSAANVWRGVLGASQATSSPPVYNAYKIHSEASISYTASWNSIRGASVYYLKKKSGLSGSWSGWSAVTSNTERYSTLTASNGGTYYYKLKACASTSQLNCAEQSDELKVSVHTLSAPSRPRLDGSSSPINYGAAYTIRWNAYSFGSPTGLSYTLEESFDSTESRHKLGSARSWAYSGIGSPKDTGDYTYKVKACLSVGRCTSYSSSLTLRIQ